MLPATCFADTICFDTEQYRHVLQLAYKGKSCDSILTVRNEREEKMQATIDQQHKMIKRANRRKKVGGFLVTSLGVAVLVETIVIVAKD